MAPTFRTSGPAHLLLLVEGLLCTGLGASLMIADRIAADSALVFAAILAGAVVSGPILYDVSDRPRWVVPVIWIAAPSIAATLLLGLVVLPSSHLLGAGVGFAGIVLLIASATVPMIGRPRRYA